MARIKTVVSARWGDKYGPEYSDALRAQVPGLVVLGEDRPFIEPDKFEKWWCKHELFRPENADLRPALFIDLDTYVMGDLTPILELPGDRLWLIADFNRPEKRSESGLFIAPAGPVSDEIWRKACLPQARNFYGDGAFLNTLPHSRITDEVDGIMSYKVHRLQESSKGARIVCFHGKPNPHEVGEGWAKDFWTTKISQWRNSAQSSVNSAGKARS